MKSILFKVTLVLVELATIVRIPMRDGVKLFTIGYAPKAHDVKYP